MSEEEREGRDFESRFRDWARRAPRKDAKTAARIVHAGLDSRLPWLTSRLGLVAAGAAVALFVASWLFVRSRPQPVAPPIVEATTLDEDIVLWWLDEETPVYFVLPADGDKQKGGMQ